MCDSQYVLYWWNHPPYTEHPELQDKHNVSGLILNSLDFMFQVISPLFLICAITFLLQYCPFPESRRIFNLGMLTAIATAWRSG